MNKLKKVKKGNGYIVIGSYVQNESGTIGRYLGDRRMILLLNSEGTDKLYVQDVKNPTKVESCNSNRTIEDIEVFTHINRNHFNDLVQENRLESVIEDGIVYLFQDGHRILSFDENQLRSNTNEKMEISRRKNKRVAKESQQSTITIANFNIHKVGIYQGLYLNNDKTQLRYKVRLGDGSLTDWVKKFCVKTEHTFPER